MSDEAEALEALILRVEKLEERIDALEKKPKKAKGTSDGSRIFEAYRVAYVSRHGVEPLRNALVNSQASLIASRVGVDDGIELVKFYLCSDESFYRMKNHPLALCLKDAETLYARMKGAQTVSTKQAKALEEAQGNASASTQYLQKKYSK